MLGVKTGEEVARAGDFDGIGTEFSRDLALYVGYVCGRFGLVDLGRGK